MLLEGKVALITGAASGVGMNVAGAITRRESWLVYAATSVTSPDPGKETSISIAGSSVVAQALADDV